MRNNILVMCDGSGSRWNHPTVKYKQLININGVPLLCRTLDQIRPYGNVIVIGNDDFKECIPEGITLTTIGYRDNEYRPLLDGILRCRSFWTKRTYILLGDVVYSNNAIESIFNVELSCWILGRTGSNRIIGKHAGELFSLVFNPGDEDMENNIKNVLSKHPTGKLWDYYREYCTALLELNDYTDDIDSPQAYEQFYERLCVAAKED